jgi:hypothetical protein
MMLVPIWGSDHEGKLMRIADLGAGLKKLNGDA